jgi:hypothetical protein
MTAIMALTLACAPFVMAPPLVRADNAGDQVTVKSRPAVGLILLDKLMSGRSQVGDTVHYETLANVRDARDQVIIPAGSPAIGHITRSKGSGMFGKRGQLEFTCEYVVLPDGSHVALTGSRLGGPGANGTGATVAVTLLVSPLGLLIKGGTAKYEKGTPVVMYVADGAAISPTQNAPDELVADFAFRDKHEHDVTGKVSGFDGDTYTVKSDDGPQTLSVKDVASISIDVQPGA